MELCLPIQQFVCEADRDAWSMDHRRINLLLICSTRFGTKQKSWWYRICNHTKSYQQLYVMLEIATTQNRGGTGFATTQTHIISYKFKGMECFNRMI